MNINAVEIATNELQKNLRIWKHDFITKYGKIDVPDTKKLQLLEIMCKKADLNYLEKQRGFACIVHVFWCKTLIQFFVDRGMDVNSRDENGDTALHLAIRHANQWDFSKKDQKNNPAKVVKLLLEKSADPRIANLRGESAIFPLAEWHLWVPKLTSNQLSKMLMERCSGAVNSPANIMNLCINTLEGGIDFKTSYWNYCHTLLMKAAVDGNLPDCKRLVKMGANVNVRDLQGYTALHHAALQGKEDCAKFLIKNGADLNAKSLSGKDAFDLSLYNYHKVNTLGAATPAKEAEMYEIAGAKIIISNGGRFLERAVEMWENAMNIYVKKAKVPPPPEFSKNYKYLKANQEWDLTFDFEAGDELRSLAMKTVTRLSGPPILKFWNFMSLSNSLLDDVYYLIGFLEFLAEDLKKPDLEELASVEQIDFLSLLDLVRVMDRWLLKAIDSGEKDDATPENVNLFHSVARLIIACLNKLKHETKCNNVPDDCMYVYVKLCHVLTLLHTRFADVISESALNDNKGVLKNLFETDPRDQNGNSFLHLVLGEKGLRINDLGFEPDLLATLVDFEFVDVKSKNRAGFEPVQFAQWRVGRRGICKVEERFLKVMLKMADRGAHVDAGNLNWEEPRFKDVLEIYEENPKLAFRYDSLQCACARVLIASLVPYANRNGMVPKVPEHLIDFIRSHHLQ